MPLYGILVLRFANVQIHDRGLQLARGLVILESSTSRVVHSLITHMAQQAFFANPHCLLNFFFFPQHAFTVL